MTKYDKNALRFEIIFSMPHKVIILKIGVKFTEICVRISKPPCTSLASPPPRRALQHPTPQTRALTYLGLIRVPVPITNE